MPLLAVTTAFCEEGAGIDIEKGAEGWIDLF